MANIKTTAAEWATAKKLFEAGKLLRVISEKTGISVPCLSKKAKSESWQRSTAIPEAEKPDADISKQVKTMAAYGLVDHEIAAVVGVSLDALRLNYAKELVTAGPEMVARVAQSMFKMATDANKPNVTAAIFWLKCRGGWVEEAEKNGSLGKKEIREKAAAKVATGGRFGASAPPKLIVNNNR